MDHLVSLGICVAAAPCLDLLLCVKLAKMRIQRNHAGGPQPLLSRSNLNVCPSCVENALNQPGLSRSAISVMCRTRALYCTRVYSWRNARQPRDSSQACVTGAASADVTRSSRISSTSAAQEEDLSSVIDSRLRSCRKAMRPMRPRRAEPRKQDCGGQRA